ncbi:hypothetical protein CHLRE_01g033150v5 [Chlamydomonas reinhardtii]|uniref:Coenzyme Q-binding protein COQ10 START domain-containing protein n=1 Tax=Chlamydomonas reinhardtii TaxID=3055 RepID=A8HQR3_CHLRE|nr:uncharacterized protein CHLRE_01g033150v5 [Chlamydomonas reinhardtii]PNW88525.1 hypothetical protein CHLRE_01g033150v5 [Chlamydomonas reinhardtii]|eukprot:XP_001689612.1 predicted protein [Chlamydomonas reinhardtii]
MGKAQESKNAEDRGTTEAWKEKDQAITVTEGNGFLYNLKLRAKVDATPSDIYDILTDPNTVSIFRSIKECTYRNEVENDGKGRRKLEIGHRALARFLFINITFETHLHVWEDDVAKTIRFQMAKPGMMQKFDGCWEVKPFTQATLDAIYHPDKAAAAASHHHHHNPFGPQGLFGFLGPKPAEATESLVTLEQSILPRGPTPPGVKGLIRGLCAHQIRCMMEDLRKELQRRKEGTSWVKPVVPEEAEEAARKGGNGKLRQQAAPAASSSLAAASLWRNAAPINIVVQL